MNFAQVCITVTCAVTAFVGCGDDREAVSTSSSSPSAGEVGGAGRTAPAATPRTTRAGDVAADSINHPPDAQHDWLTVVEDTSGSIDVTLNDTDPDGDPLTVVDLGLPGHGTATFSGNLVTYTPDLHYVGSDEFEYTISDGNGGMGVASVFVTVTAANAPPAAVDDALTIPEDTPGAINLLANDSDPDGDALTVVAFGAPAHGSVSVTSGVATYTPAANYNGPDAFGYTVQDPGGLTSSATVHVTVSPVNDPPVAAGDAASLLEDTGATIDVAANDSDVDGDALAIASITQPAHGIAAIVDGAHVSYTPAPNYNGADSFSYTIADPSGAQATAQVAITVIAVNDPPVAAGDAASLDEDTQVTIDVAVNDSDVDGDALAVASITQPAHGIAAIVDATHVSYTPAPNYNGADSFSYTIADGHGGQATAQVALAIAPVNDPPVAAGDAASLDEDTQVTVDVAANDSDVDGDALAIASITQPAHGTAAIAGPHQVTYTPAANYNGADAFQYTIADPSGATATATVTLAIAPVNDPPVAAGDAASLDEDTRVTVDVAANDSDVDGDALAIASITQPAHGTAAIAGPHQVTYTPAANYNGADAFQYTIADPSGATATATVTLAIAPVNDPPVAADVSASTFDDTPATATFAATDADGDALAFAIAAPPAHGTLGPVVGGHVTYTPAPGFAGGDAFTYVASDGQASSAPATVHVTVVASVCGNGVREGVHEECDDGNTAPGDGCEPGCKLTCGSGTGAERATVDAASGHCFAAYDGVQHSYQDAAAMCTALGGHLPTITSASEDAAAFAAVHPGDTPWLGADDIAARGTFGWLTGEPFTGYSHFHAGEPDGAGGADCVQYLADGTWSDAPCSGTTTGVTGTLCELELAVGTPALATGGGGTRGLAIADVNGDGHADIAAINPANNTVGILLGDGAGGFALQATYATGAGPVAIAAGDFDGDGHPDLAVVDATASTVGILRGSASGGFTAGATVAVAAGSTAIAIADLDGDGVLDLAVAATGTVRLLHGDGSGGFSALGALAITGTPAAIAAGDFNRDGHVDLALATASAVLVATATGGGAFGAPATLATSTGNRGIVARDLDGDGNLDLAVAGGAAQVTLWFGTASGAFEAPSSLTVAGAPQWLAAGDFDGDGGADLVAGMGGFATLLHGAGRAFTAAGPAIATGGGGASFAAAADVNGDGAADLVVANAATSSAGIVLGGAGGLVGARALPIGTGTTATVSADFNQDGRADLAVIDPAASKVYVFLQTTAGALVQSAALATPPGGNASYGVAADFDGDGHLDLAVVNVAFNSVSVFLGTGAGTFGTFLNTGTGSSPRRPSVGDFNGDGRPDLAVPAASGNAVSILVNTGGGHFGHLPDIPAGAAPAATVVGDFNGDGKKDIAVATTGEASVKVLLGHGDDTFSAATAFPVASAGQAIAAGDLDGDGSLDLVVTDTTTASVSVLRGNGAGGFAAATSLATGAQPSAVVAIDLDGDGKLDLVVGNAGTNDVTVLHNGGAAGFVGSRFPLGTSPGCVSVADLDHDGHLDIAATSASTFATLLYSGR